MDARSGGALTPPDIASLPPRQSPLRGGYLVQNPWLWWYLRTTDALLGAVRSRTDVRSEAPVRRVLVAIGGHVGDAILATASLDLLHALVPAAELDVVMPSWSQPVLQDDARVRRIHLVDHWRLNRASVGIATKVAHYARTVRRAVVEIREQRYDVGVDLYPFYPNMGGILWRAGIARRFGFASGGRAPLYTQAAAWTSDSRHLVARQAALVRSVVGADDETAVPPSTLPAPSAAALESVASVFARAGVAGPYVVLHTGSGLRKKEWPGDAWHRLARHLGERGLQIVLTGAGDAERAQAGRVAANVPGCVVLVDQLDWQALCAVVSGASAVVSADTSVAHLAAARGTPRVVIFSGINSMDEWHPVGAHGAQGMLQHPMPCAPCYRRDGCAAMSCVTGVTVDDVVAALGVVMGSDRHGPPTLSRV